MGAGFLGEAELASNNLIKGGSLFQNPNAPPTLNLRDTAPLLAQNPLRENGLPASLHSLFDTKLRSPVTTKHSSSLRGRVDLMDTDVVVSGEHETSAVAGSLRELHEITRSHTLDKDVIVVDNSKNAPREVYEIPRDIREKRDIRASNEVPRRNEGIRNGSYANYDNSESLHIEGMPFPPSPTNMWSRKHATMNNNTQHYGQHIALFSLSLFNWCPTDEGEESERKRLKTDADRQRAQATKLQSTLRSTHPRSPHVTPHLPSPRSQSPLQHPNFHQFQLQAQVCSSVILFLYPRNRILSHNLFFLSGILVCELEIP